MGATYNPPSSGNATELQGIPISSAPPPTNGQALVFQGGQWVPTTISGAVGNNNQSVYLTGPVDTPNNAIQQILQLTVAASGIYVIEAKVVANNNVVELGVLDVWISPNNIVTAGAWDAASMGLGTVAGRNQYDVATLVTVASLTAGQNIYLMCFANTPNIIIFPSTELETIQRATGINIWRIY
jgi:hypothetical protein